MISTDNMGSIDKKTNGESHQHPVTGRFEFWEVFRDELQGVQARRKACETKCVGDRPVIDVGQALPEREQDGSLLSDQAKTHQLQEFALKHDLCGLAISGGGIRSATFALGVLQALAFTGLLRRFDYLSTVSGGGYIGSWLTVGIKP